MYVRLFKFILASLALHMAVLWLFWQPHFEHGTARGSKSGPLALAVTIVPSTGVAPHSELQPQEAPAAEPALPVEKTPFASARSAADGDLSAMPGNGAESAYMSGALLTRLPMPLENIDLNAPEISELAFAGEATLTLLVDADGTVADVIAETGSEHAREFALLVAARFKATRFTPGQINGRSVRSALQITVVSESLVATGE